MLCIYYIIFVLRFQDFCRKYPHGSFYRLFIHIFSNLHNFIGKQNKKTPFSRRFLCKIDVFYYFDLRLCKKLLELLFSSKLWLYILFSLVLYLYSGKTSFVSLVLVAYASSRSASTSSFASSAITSSSFGCVFGCLGVNTVQQSS